MKFRSEVLIDADRDTVWDAFDDPSNLGKWQPTLKSFEHESGLRGQRGAVSVLTYDENGREVRLIETITERRRPDFLAGTYESRDGNMLVVHHFEPLDGRTRWVSYANHRFRGFRKLTAPFAAKRIRERMSADMQRFKRLVESARGTQ